MSDISIRKTDYSDSLKLSNVKAPVSPFNNNSTVSADSLKSDFTEIKSLTPVLKNFQELDNVFAGKSQLKPLAKGNSVIALQRGLKELGYNEIIKIDGLTI